MNLHLKNNKLLKTDFNLKYRTVCLIFVFLSCFNQVKSAQTVISISGDITKDTVLDADTIKITGDVNVYSNVTLTITQGSYVKLMGDFGFTINGKMMAIGQPGDSITFSIKDTGGFANVNIINGGWKGFVIAGSGTHIEKCRINHIKRSKAESGTEKSGIKISKNGTIISGNNFRDNITQCGVISAISGGDSCIITNNTFSYNKDYGNTGTTTYMRGAIFDIYYSNGHIIQNNYVYHNYNISGVNCKFLIGFVISLGSTFSNNTISDNYGVISLNGVTGTFSSNIIKSNTSTGFNQIMSLDWNSCPNIINNQFLGNVGIIYISSCKPSFVGNLVANNTGNLYLSGGAGLYVNNTIVNNSSMVYLLGNTLPKMTNNIFWGNNSGSYQISIDGYSEPEINNCDIQNGASGITFTASAYFPPVFNNVISLNPAFVSPSGGCGATFYNPSNDWKLKTASPFSPCINVGLNIPELSLCAKDISGNNRICNGTVDIGSYETHIKSISTSGVITKDTLWIADTVNVTGYVTVNPHIKLTIAAGTKVIFHGKRGLIIKGSLVAEADKNHPILFIRPDSASFFSSKDSCWSGLRFMSTSDTSYLTNCTIQYSDTALYFMMAYNIFVNDCRIQYNNQAINTQSASKSYFKNTLIYMNQRSWPSIYLQNANAQFEFCRILNNDFCQSYNSDKIIISNCLLANNNQFDFGSSDCEIINSTFVNNTQIGFGYSIPRIYNTIFYTAGSLFFRLYGINCSPKFYNCLFKSGYTYTSGFSIVLNNSLTAFPAFFQPTSGDGDTYDAINADFRIKSTSPAINAGTSYVSGYVLPNYDINGNPRINGDSIDIGTYENQSSKLIFTQQPVGGIHCASDYITFSISVSDTATYQWQKDGQDITGAIKPVYSIASLNENEEGNYICIASNTYGSISSNPAFIKVLTAPEITDEPSSSLINKNSPVTLIAKADGSRPLSRKWLLDGIELPDTTFKLYIDSFKTENEGTYICEMTNSCGSVTTDPAVLSLAPAICLVTVSTPKPGEQGHNEIVFDKESKINYTDYKIYRESEVAGYYYNIGDVSSTQPGLFIDSAADPNEQAYLYKIAGVKADKSETDINSCLIHKPIHLLATKGEMGGVQLDWDQYIGFDYNTYFIYRKSTNEDSFRIVHTMSSSTRTWTDDTVVGSNDTLFYYISVRKEGGCNPFGKRKGGSDIYSQSASNMEDNRLRSTEISKTNVDKFNLTCYPNPFNDITNISYNLQRTSSVSLKVINLLGDNVVELVNAKQTAGNYHYLFNATQKKLISGIYILKFKAGDSEEMRRIIHLK